MYALCRYENKVDATSKLEPKVNPILWNVFKLTTIDFIIID